jgi:(1->4)-alpha-D-glucan 1-alpha-D-glucosylmutase
MPPTSTYRLQLRREFGFSAAAAVVPYLADLGISHVYCSPVLQAVPGSAHGYDVIDHRRLSDDLGGDAGWAELTDACRRHGLGLVIDIVPNHMAVPVPEELNAALWDVLRLGRSSPHAQWFDVDWDAQDGRILMPMLGRPLDQCLADGEITVDVGGGVVRYHDHRFPLAPGTATLDEQHYRLADWRAGADALNYRRFFDVTSLIGVRVEAPTVFDATHERLLALVRSGDVDGLRVDHPDGLADPGGYLDRLAKETGGVWTTVEKILEPGEVLPPTWQCAGTTGYDALAAVTNVLVDPAGEQPLTDLYTSLTGLPASFHDVVRATKRLVVDRILAAEVNRLSDDLEHVRADVGATSAFTRPALREAVAQLLVSFDVYRAYAGDADSARRIDEAASRAVQDLPARASEIAWIGSLLHRIAPGAAADAFAVRFEQTTGPAMAKGVEDTAFYRYHRLTALNEVGGDPARFGGSVADWHAHCRRIQRDWPATMTTLSTHDTKRSEDVRARLLVLAELPVEWSDAVTRWRAAASKHSPPDANTDYLFWQTLAGAWPLSVDRMLAYVEKATREAKQHTSWTDPDEAYDAQLRGYVRGVFADHELMQDVGAFVETALVEPGRSNALAQKLLQLTMPGVPDLYQGQELTEPTLVDPDNRRPVDYAARAAMLGALDAADPKLSVTARSLRLRRERPDVFAAGYEPVGIVGAAADHALAFARGDDAISVVTRLPVGLRRRGGWGETALQLPPGDWSDTLTGAGVRSGRLAEVLARLPVALLVRAGG